MLSSEIAGFAVSGEILNFIWAVKAAQDWQWRWMMVPGIGGRFGVLGGD
jgi:hypothetical protein